MIYKRGVALLGACALVLGLSLPTRPLLASDWQPPGPVKLLIAFTAGGGADTQGRMIAEAIETTRGWKIIPENVTGKGGINMLNALKDMPADGTVWGLGVTESLAYNMLAAGNTGMSAGDFTALATTAGFQMGVIARSAKGWNTFADVVTAARSGEEIRFGVMSPRLADLAYLLGKAQGFDPNIVMLRGGRAVLNAINAGDVDIGWAAGIQAKGVQAGDLVNLASGLSTPLVLSPDAPLLADLGVEYNADGYFLWVAPKNLPDEARRAIAGAIAEIATDPQSEAGKFLQAAFGGPVVISGATLDTLIDADVAAAQGLLNATAE